MPLRAPGKAVVVSPPPLGAKTLNVPWIKQEQTNWCWAACCQMVFNYYGLYAVHQCNMASWLFGADCCAAPSSTLCNQGATADQIVRVYNVNGFQCSYSNGAFSFGQLQWEIDNNRPLEPAFFWNGGGGHVVIVKAYYDNQTTYVNDPWYGQGVVKYADLLTAYGMGRWALTFFNLRR
jgi:ABC-type bacteriocin/lantibiotic exporter with double-glycine peptidase domain